jgi:hypothetical protein
MGLSMRLIRIRWPDFRSGLQAHVLSLTRMCSCNSHRTLPPPELHLLTGFQALVLSFKRMKLVLPFHERWMTYTAFPEGKNKESSHGFCLSSHPS